MNQQEFGYRDFSLDIARATEQAAIAAYWMLGRGDEKGADQMAVNAMRKALNDIAFRGRVVIGEGERDKAPMLYIGEEVGNGYNVSTQDGSYSYSLYPEIDIALDPLEGTTILATGGAGALSVCAITGKGGFLHAPDIYMEKIAIGFDFPEPIIDLDETPLVNLQNVAKAKGKDISELVVIVLNRPRHSELIAKIREAGCRVQLIQDGDIAAVIATSAEISSADIYMGIGGAPEGVLAAAALSVCGGQMRGRLLFDDETEIDRARAMGVSDPKKQYYLEEMASGDIIFSATGVTDGPLLDGVKICKKNRVTTHSLLMNSRQACVRKIKNTNFLSTNF